MRVHVDFETRSAADLKRVGAWLYAEHPSTSIMCMSFAVDDEDPICLPMIATPGTYNPYWVFSMARVKQWAHNPDVLFVAHNAAFEQAFWKTHMVGKYGFPELPPNRWIDTMAKCAAHALPMSLEGAAKALQLSEQKDMVGSKAMLKLCKPKKDGTFWEYHECPEDFEAMFSYCNQDVIVERKLDHMLADLNPVEQKVWVIDQRMNQQGIYIDRPTVSMAIGLAEEFKDRTKASFKDITGLNPGQRAAVGDWLFLEGCDIPNTKSSTTRGVIADDKVDDRIRQALTLMGEANKNSIAKYRTMLQRSREDGLMREILAYHAAITGRFGGRGVQIQNLPRPTMDIEAIIHTMRFGYESFSLIYPAVAAALSCALRGMIVAPTGKKMMVADLSQMEARVLAWLAGEQGVLDVFRAGTDLYCYQATQFYGREITKADKDERQVGKVGVLAFGYQGGIGALDNMAKAYGLDISRVAASIINSATPDEVESAEFCYMLYMKNWVSEEKPTDRTSALAADILKQRWRRSNPAIVRYWNRLEDAAIEAVITPGGKFVVRAEEHDGHTYAPPEVVFFMNGIFLQCQLPCKRVISYPYPKVTQGEKGKMTLSYHTPEKGRVTTYGGKLAENLTQAVQRDLLVYALIRLESKYPVAFHVHDEVISYVDMDASLSDFESILKMVPRWAEGIPIDAKGWEGFRYGKE